ncbi:GNAT family N-acetyltransferase [Streptomyces sp. NPDC012769]|uniref:GNAT family N-acetyltransferase n=1 Tax=Streptomyces sp. NPDC012769 TaxID=3364848 RepID=UPI0036CE7BF2
MDIPMLWRRGARRPPFAIDDCGGGHHVLRTARLVVRTPRDHLDEAIGEASSADAEAQRWLGYPAGSVFDGPTAQFLLSIDDSNRAERLRALRAHSRRQLTRPFVPGDRLPRLPLLAVEAATGRVVGMSSVTMDTRTIGLQIAPAHRRQGLGHELVQATARIAHTHLGLEVVWAGTEASNDHCREALTTAGFVPCDGPARHTLPDGRVIDSVWYQHGMAETSRCDTVPPDPGDTP